MSIYTYTFYTSIMYTWIIQGTGAYYHITKPQRSYKEVCVYNDRYKMFVVCILEMSPPPPQIRPNQGQIKCVYYIIIILYPRPPPSSPSTTLLERTTRLRGRRALGDALARAAAWRQTNDGFRDRRL